MKYITILFLFNSIFIQAQNDTLQLKLDSIVNEADLLYQYEKAAWNSSDIMNENKLISESFGGYFVYHQNDSIKVVYFDKSLNQSIGKFTYLKNQYRVPLKFESDIKNLNEEEKKHAQVRTNFISYLNTNISSFNYVYEEGFTPNIVIIPQMGGYRAYLIMGANVLNVIPFGNDYIFILDESGNIIHWKKFHNSLIKTIVKDESGNNVISFIHSHLPMTPYISATDICTFRLYGADLFGKESFIVSSTALDLLFEYNVKTNNVRYFDADQISQIMKNNIVD